MKVCCFTGHRNLSYGEREQVLSVLTQKIEELIISGIAVFINGGALGGGEAQVSGGTQAQLDTRSPGDSAVGLFTQGIAGIEDGQMVQRESLRCR